MKRFCSFITTLFLILSISAQSWTVNNTPGSSADFSDLTTAHDSASDGDTLYIHGSSISYGTLDVTKRLVFIGPGYFLEQNLNTPVSLSAIVHNFDLLRTNEDDPFSGASGTQILGLSFTQTNNTRINIFVSDIVVTNCEVDDYISFSKNDISSIGVFNCYFHRKGVSTNTGSIQFNDFIFSNNIVNGEFSIPDNSKGSILHNLFLGGRFIVEAFSGEIRSNIITSPELFNFSVSLSGTGQISHNTAANGLFGSDNNNNIALPDALFVGAEGNSQDGQYQLRDDATAAKGNAHDGTDRGPFGGGKPYTLSGLVDIPYIISLEVPATGRPSETFTIRITARARN